MSRLLEKRNTIYGICAIWIMLFHIFRRIGMPYIPIITNVIGIGNMAVDIFFFFSGLCLSLSVKKHNYLQKGWSSYFKRRFVRILLPYFIICLPFYLWNAIFEIKGDTIHKIIMFFANLSSVSFWLKGTQTTWYIYGIMVFYLIFPLLYTFFVKRGRKSQYITLVGLIAFALITAYIPIFKNSTIVWARLPIFSIGVCMGINEIKIRELSKKEFVVLGIVLIALGAVVSISELSESFSISQVYRFLLYIPMTLVLLLILNNRMYRSRIIEYVGGISLEIYLLHITLLHPIKYYGIIDELEYWLYIILPTITIILAIVVQRIEKAVPLK